MSLPLLFFRVARRSLLTLLGCFVLLLAACGGSTSSLDTPGFTGPGGASGAAGAGGGVGLGGAGNGPGGASGAPAGGKAGAGAQAGGPGKGGSSAGSAGHPGGSGGASVGTGGAAGGAGAFGGSAGTGGAVTPVSLGITPPAAQLGVGTSAQLKATAIFSDGSTQDVTAKASWGSSAPGVASVTAGLVQASSPGVTQISASLGALGAKAAVTVTSAKPVSLSLTPPSLDLGVGGTAQLTATLFLSDGSTQNVSGTASFTSSASGVASVDSQGLVSALAGGSATIQASLLGLSAQSIVTVASAKLVSIAVSPKDPVLGVGVALSFTAVGTYSDKSVSDVTKTVAWSSSSPMVLGIDAAGNAGSLSVGTALVTAALSGVTGSSTVTVSAATVTSLVVTPAQTTLAVSGAAQLTATATFSDGSTADVTQSALWSSSASATASVSNAAGSQGQVTALAPGMSTLTAALQGATASAQVTVLGGQLVSISLKPSQTSLGKGTSAQLTATGTYSDGSTVDVTQMATWTSSDPTIAGVANGPSAGLVSAVTPGMVTITAQLGAVSATAQITVVNAVLQSITVGPAASNLAAGDREYLVATAVYSDGTMVVVTEQATWASSDDAVATASNVANVRGQVTGEGPGAATITASFGGASGQASVNVSQPMLSSLSISPTDPTRFVGQPQQFQAIAIFSNGTQKNVTALAAWSSADAAVATIGMTQADNGRATPVAPGATVIAASWMGQSAQTTLTVSAATIASLQVSPDVPSVTVGVNVPFQATAIYSDGTSQNVTKGATWVSTDPAIATVSSFGPSKGRATSVAPGQTQIQATYMGLTGQTTLTVTNAVIMALSVNPAQVTDTVGGKRQFTAQAIYSDGTSMDVTGAATWQSSDTNVADVNTAGFGKGLATAIGPGTADVQATYMGVTGHGTFLVTSATIQSISVGPPDPSTGVGVKVKLFATAILSDGSSQDITGAATWTSSDPSIAAVSDAGGGQKGLVTPLAPGVVTITAQFQGVAGTTTVTVKSAKLTQIQVTPINPTMPIGYDQGFVAVGVYSDLTTQVLTGQVTWTSSAPAVASVSDAPGSKGRVAPLSAGMASIQAAYGGVTGSSQVTVSAATLQSITVAPATATVGVGTTQAFTATGDFGGGLTLDITGYVTWLSTDTAVLGISNAPGTHGEAKGLSAGMATITANKDGVSGQAAVTVQ